MCLYRSGSTSFSNFFKFVSAFTILSLVALIDFNDSTAALTKSGGFFNNDLKGPEYVRKVV